MDSNNCLNEVYSAFNMLHKELLSGFHLVDSFPNWFSFHIVNYKDNEVMNAYLWALNKISEDFSSNPNSILVISNVSIKKNVVTSILHICSSQNIITKTIHHVINITSTEAELFSIKCRINQVIQVQNTENIILITNAIHVVRWIFNLFFHPYQLYLIAIYDII